MTVLFMEGFEQYGDAIGPQSRWSAGFDVEAPGRFNYGRCGRFQGQSVTTTIRPDGGVQADFSIGIGMRFDNDSISVGDRMIFQFAGNNGANRQFSIMSRANGQIAVVNNDNSGAIACISDPGALAVGSWDYFEFSFHHDGTSDTGSNARIKKNGTVIAEGLGVNLRANSNYTPDTIRWQMNYRTFIDDIYVVDSYTSLGDRRVFSMVPTADTADKDFTASSGSDNFAMVDDLPFNTSDYVAASAAGALDLYALSDLPFTPVSITAVQAHYLMAKDDATERTARVVLKSGSTVFNGDTVGVPSSFSYGRSAILETDPNTSAAWTAAAVDALQAGLEVVS